MKVSVISTFIFLIPFCVFSQEMNLTDNHSSVKKKEHKPEYEQLYVVTPVLLRESSPFNLSDDEYALLNRNKFHSFLSSLIIPGSGQIFNKSWIRAGLFLAVEATSIYLFVDSRNSGRAGERNYEKWANRNWSVVEYSQWLVDYHEINGLDNPHIDELKSMVRDEEASFNVDTDWEKVELTVLRNVERNTPYITADAQAANNFSHVLPDYGSQQYYELISKYYQYQAGWRDYDVFHDNLDHTHERFLIDRGGAYASPYFYQGAQMADRFNSDFRRSGYFLSILIVNHVLSAFDAYFTLKVKQNRLQAASSLVPGKQISLSYRF